jgi:hypothetical protein
MSLRTSRPVVCLLVAVVGLGYAYLAFAAEPSQEAKDVFAASVKNKFAISLSADANAGLAEIAAGVPSAAAPPPDFARTFVGGVSSFYITGLSGKAIFVISDPATTGGVADTLTWFPAKNMANWWTFHADHANFDFAFPKTAVAGDIGTQVGYALKGSDHWYGYDTSAVYANK